MSLSKAIKVEMGIVAVLLIGSVVGTLQGVFHFTQTADVVAMHAVDSQAAGMVNVDFADEQNNYFVSDGKTIWDVKLAKENGDWAVQNVTQTGKIDEKLF